jgi:hypothetical protein
VNIDRIIHDRADWQKTRSAIVHAMTDEDASREEPVGSLSRNMKFRLVTPKFRLRMKNAAWLVTKG